MLSADRQALYLPVPIIAGRKKEEVRIGIFSFYGFVLREYYSHQLHKFARIDNNWEKIARVVRI